MVDHALKGVLSKAVTAGDFRGKLNQTSLFYTNGDISPERILLIGLGNKRDFSLEKLREVSGTSAVRARKLGVKMISTTVNQLTEDIFDLCQTGQAITEGTLLALYTFKEYKTEKKDLPKEIDTLNIILPLRHKRQRKVEEGVVKGEKIASAVSFARDLISNPGNVTTPEALALTALTKAKEEGIKAEVLDKKDMESLGMGALLGVSKGSSETPKMIILEYGGGRSTDSPYVLVGKAITFDSGGISIKPSAGMEEMKTDMSGGAAVLGALFAAAALKLPINLVAIVPSAENLPGGSAYKPGDILRSMSGLTIEVLNTDAEGRLILADALTYAGRYNPKALIDVATLTGACVVALGNHASGLLGNNEALKKELLKAGEESGERLWELPLWEPYRNQIKSDIADIKNTGGKEAGTITAAAFLEKFTGKYHWAHIDIAGTAWVNSEKPYIPKGAVGVGVRLLVKFLENVIKG